MFGGISTKVESGGITSYGRGIEGVFLDPKRDVMIRFTLDRPGRYEFRCSIHPTMKGELLLLNVEAV
jgi:plastocyanin